VDPGGCFPPQEVENSLRPPVLAEPGSKPKTAKRRASAVGSDDEHTIKPKRKYKPREPKVPQPVVGGLLPGGGLGGLDRNNAGNERRIKAVMELGMQQPVGYDHPIF
jgi:hypothetical protein